MEAASFGHPAFHPDGARFASIINRDSEHWFVCWNLRDGKLETEFPVPVPGSSLHWTGENELLADNASVIDVSRRMIVWQYGFGPSVVASEHPAARHWSLTQSEGEGCTCDGDSGEASAAELLQAKPQPQMVLQPGGKISIEFDSPEPPVRQTI